MWDGTVVPVAENPGLSKFLLYARSSSGYSFTCFAYCQQFYRVYFCLPNSFNFILPPTTTTANNSNKKEEEKKKSRSDSSNSAVYSFAFPVHSTSFCPSPLPALKVTRVIKSEWDYSACDYMTMILPSRHDLPSRTRMIGFDIKNDLATREIIPIVLV